MDVKKIKDMKDYKQYFDTAENLYPNFHPKKLKSLSNEELHEHIIKSYDLMCSLLASTIFCESLDKELVKEFYEQINKDDSGFNEFFKMVTIPAFESFAIWFDNELINYEENNDIDPYTILWAVTDYSFPVSLEKCPIKVKDVITKKGGIEKIKAEQKQILKEIEKNSQLIKEYTKGLGSELKAFFDFVQYSMFLRDSRKKPLQKSIAMISISLREFFKRQNISEKYLYYAHYHDFTGKLYKSKDYEKILEKRDNGIIGYFTSDGSEIFSGDIKEVEDEIYRAMNKGNSTEVKGSVAYKGKVQGIVKIITNKQEFDRFNEGEILVTSMTRPEFVPLMKKAAAVITDEGGITCHAAIVSRELKKPCIIGTRNATRALKDGDLVEVDADKGVVRVMRETK
ncbi:hypothetical protein GOV14_05545 [Candidatus Pacearchaeota archaeon]|nr:hypothetical protein [Candidatus Pacearchaeota archaeon]